MIREPLTPRRERFKSRYPFREGDTVCDKTDPKRLAKVVKAGPDQSEVRWLDTKGLQYVVNNWMRKARGGP